ncbi:hypothetical protein MNBD_GAMMA09-460 [hydrothermal vent metagenome]|uniref:DUF72 domain-containing protein n=1 Tax=hydrothermal vent metagenome TaxID=652676 RepID=A0A3B0X8X4_9ZZZZ
MIHDNSLQDETAFVSDTNSPGILLGACGWNHAHWLGDFYPHDLPQDWYLSYYANEFSAVLLPENQWQNNLMALEEWAFDVSESFRFYLHSRCSAGNSGAINPLSAAKALAGRFAGIVNIPPGEHHIQVDKAAGVAVINMASQDMRGWRHWLEQHAPALQAVFLNDESLSYQQLSDFKTLLELMGV